MGLKNCNECKIQPQRQTRLPEEARPFTQYWFKCPQCGIESGHKTNIPDAMMDWDDRMERLAPKGVEK